ncbi:MAG TPA: DUF2283 domain-containing protein [Anaerolineae bacterium]|nr:DUF2283 domain-containing protein [Anaerolineae bacterium]
MKQRPDWIIEKKVVLADGTAALWSYDTEGDFLEIFFHEAPASATVELADGIFLRFDRKRGRPLSLGFAAVTPLTQQQEFGPPLLTLTGLGKLPVPEQKIVLKILQSPPVNTILKIYSFTPGARARAIPVASLEQPVPLMA